MDGTPRRYRPIRQAPAKPANQRFSAFGNSARAIEYPDKAVISDVAMRTGVECTHCTGPPRGKYGHSIYCRNGSTGTPHS